MLFNHGDFAGAEAKYRQAYDASRDPRLLFNAAVCEKSMKHYVRMREFLLRFAAEEGSAISAEDQTTVEEAVAAIKQLVGVVTVTTNVPGATVTVDDEPAGTTPLPAPLLLDLGKHRVGVNKDGFDASARTVEVAGGVASNENFTLVERSHIGQLVVVAEPDATIAVDGKVAAKERFDGPLPAGNHEVQVTAPGKAAYRSDVELRDRETRTLQVTLGAEGRHAPVWPWIVGGAVAAVGLGVGAYFLFRPQDQTSPVPPGPGGSVTFNAWRSW
jgi:hypothetical protein